MIALSGHTRVAFVGVGRLGGAAPLAVEGKALGSPRGIWKPEPCESPIRVPSESPSPVLCDVSSQCPTSHRAQHSAMYRARALRVTEPSTLRCAGSNQAGAHATFHSCKPALLCPLSIGGSSWIEKPDELSLYSCVASPLGRHFPRASSPEEGFPDDL